MEEIIQEALVIKKNISEAKMSDVFSMMSFFVENHSISKEYQNEMVLINFEYSTVEKEIRLKYSTPELENRKTDLLRKVLYILDSIIQKNQEAFDSFQPKEKTRILSSFIPINRLAPANSLIFKSNEITKFFDGFELGPIDLELKAGEITSIVGENGSGKTTLLKIISGLIENDGSSLEFFLCDNDNWYERRKNIAYVPQHIADDNLSPEQAIKLCASTHGIIGQENQEKFEDVVIKLSLNDYINKPWEELSGGYKLRMELAKVLVWRPKLLVLDEPLAFLDVNAQKFLLQTLRNYCDSEKYPLSIVLTSQHITEVESIADRMIFLNHGKSLYNGSMNDIEIKYPFKVIEILTSLEINHLESLLTQYNSEIKVADYYLNTAVIKIPKSVKVIELFNLITNHAGHVKYFRDISNSSKRFFI